MRAVAIIPARSGSRRIPGKNVNVFGYIPIMAHSIAHARHSGLFDEVIVTTDSPRYADIAERYGAMPVMRDKRKAEDHVGTQEVIADCLRTSFTEETLPEYTCCIYATAPMITREDLVRASQMIKLPHFDFVMTVGYPPLQDAGQFYFGKSQAFIEERPLVSHRTGMVYVPEERLCDINTPEDWAEAERKYKQLTGIR